MPTWESSVSPDELTLCVLRMPDQTAEPAVLRRCEGRSTSSRSMHAAGYRSSSVWLNFGKDYLVDGSAMRWRCAASFTRRRAPQSRGSGQTDRATAPIGAASGWRPGNATALPLRAPQPNTRVQALVRPHGTSRRPPVPRAPARGPALKSVCLRGWAVDGQPRPRCRTRRA